ncbi:metal ABC transporter permease [Nitrogeniibacter mangrovi]|uniref:Metal ABC transporter permease n=1 Tax=Nitrogeniibacter mangrovi TaxID=2016596 RepID=A0A6C1B0E6_9RHOO|nr:metal ABC transporter permease [Nitrogeniibacter mangrovi]QID16288.1 metal ABC transporter permease [Nitrogeniibacter mangrovi]
MNLLLQPFEFEFMRGALAACVALSFGAAPIGVFMLLRRMSLMGDAISHAILPGAALGYLVSGMSLGAMTLGGVTAGVAVALLAGVVARRSTLREDASLAAFYLISLAIGVLLVSVKSRNVDLLHVLFGSVLSLDRDALVLIGGIATTSLFGLALLYRPLVMECADPDFMRQAGGPGALAHLGFLLLAVLNLVAGFHALGTLMAVGVMVLPAATARLLCERLDTMLAVAVGTALLGSVGGLLASYQLDVPAGPSVVLSLGVLYMLVLSFSTLRRPRRAVADIPA